MAMQYRKIGNSGIEASVVALGAWAIGGWMWGGTEESDALKTIQASLDQGMNFIDTAAIYGYGRSEEILGKAIKSRREQVILATKCGLRWDLNKGDFHFHGSELGITKEKSKFEVYKYLHPDSIAVEIERSLKRLDTDYIDLYQTHWQDSTTPIEDTMAALMKLKDQGKIRAIGVSNANLDHLKAYGPIDTDQERYSMLDRRMEQDGTLEYCRSNNIAVLAYSPLVHGLLTGKITPDRTFNQGDLRRENPRFCTENIQKASLLLKKFHPLAQKYNATLSQLVIAWTFSQPGITHVLVGARTPTQALENAAAGDIILSPENIKTMDGFIDASDVA